MFGKRVPAKRGFRWQSRKGFVELSIRTDVMLFNLGIGNFTIMQTYSAPKIRRNQDEICRRHHNGVDRFCRRCQGGAR